MNNKYLDVSSEVKDALKSGKPVVALESTIIAHGMPYPKNVETAMKVEELIRREGAVPATIGILNGRLIAGLSKEQIDYMGKEDGIYKVSRRDIAYMVANKKDGATTVASTMIIAEMAGIKVFATGGIGGVHRGAETTMDISADLDELANTNVSVVCAGAKSILDLGLTLEYLETKGVPVLGYKTDELPAFYTRKSGFKVDYNIQKARDFAKFIKTKEDLALKGGNLIVNPIPKKYSMDHKLINKVIEEAIVEAKEKGIKGKDTTPFLLSKIKDITKGESLEANIELVYNNAILGAKIAKELSKI